MRLDFVCGNEVYGSCTELREFCEDHGQAYVLRVPSSFRLVPGTPDHHHPLPLPALGLVPLAAHPSVPC